MHVFHRLDKNIVYGCFSCFRNVVLPSNKPLSAVKRVSLLCSHILSTHKYVNIYVNLTVNITKSGQGKIAVVWGLGE